MDIVSMFSTRRCSTNWMRTPYSTPSDFSLWLISCAQTFFSSCAKNEQTAHLTLRNSVPRLIIVCSISVSSGNWYLVLLRVTIERLNCLTCVSIPLIRPTWNTHRILDLPVPLSDHFAHCCSFPVLRPCISFQHKYAL